jgi:hypothetical protein
MPELETLFLRAVERLETIHGKAAQVDADDPRRAAYVAMIVRLVKITHKRPLLVRLARCDTIAAMIYQVQIAIGDVARGFGVGEEDAEMATWRDEWQRDRETHFFTIKRLALAATGRQLVGEIQNGRLVDVMAALKTELKKDLQEEQLELKQAVFDKVTGLTPMQAIELIDSFISFDDLDFDDGPIVAGTFGEVRRATWFHEGKSDKVVVKQLLAPLSGAASDPFTRQLKVWQELPVHPNIVQLYGGCNVSLRQFYVCEEVFKGSLADYCRVPRSSVLIWKVLVQVAEGLAFLHERGIVHGGLTCNNILLGEHNVPKLSDFGFSSIRHLSMGMSVSCYRSQSTHYTDDGNTGEERLESDILAFGLCIADALKQTIPFVNGGLDVSIQRVVSKMRASNHFDRPSIQEALAEMREAFPSQPEFPMHGLPSSPPSQKTLTNLASRIQRMPENEAFLHHLMERLQYHGDTGDAPSP